MSRIGKLPIPVPAGVEVKIDGSTVSVKGPKGELTETFNKNMTISMNDDNQVIVERPNDERQNRALHGLTRSLINNMVIGVSEGYSKTLELVGVGYRASLKGDKLEMTLGYSHPVDVQAAEGIKFECPDATTIIISGVDVTFGVKPGSALITAAFGTVFNSTFSSVFIAVALTLFAYSTILGWSLYGVRCWEYLFGSRAVRAYQIVFILVIVLGLRAAKVYQLIFIVVIVVGSVSSLDFVWNIADTLNGLMAIPNFIALFALSGVVFQITKEHFRGVDLAKAKHE